MHFKLIVVFGDESRTEDVMHAAREAGAAVFRKPVSKAEAALAVVAACVAVGAAGAWVPKITRRP